jgi:AcrR family transcriptional regulator
MSTLSRARVVAAALAIVDDDGLGALNMRALAARLDTKPMSLYRHIANKAELLDAVAEEVLASVEAPDAGSGIDRALAALRSFRAALLAHPNALPLFAGAGSVGGTEQQLVLLEASLEAGGEMGLSDRDSFRAYAVALAYVVGFVMREVTSPATVTVDRTSDPTWLSFVVDNVAAFPHLERALVTLPERESPDEVFEHGLQALLRGLLAT